MTLKSIHADSTKDLITARVYLSIGHLHPKTSYNSDFESDLNEHEEHLAKILGKLPSHLKPSGLLEESPACHWLSPISLFFLL
jgi:hypothetical protein